MSSPTVHPYRPENLTAAFPVVSMKSVISVAILASGAALRILATHQALAIAGGFLQWFGAFLAATLISELTSYCLQRYIDDTQFGETLAAVVKIAKLALPVFVAIGLGVALTLGLPFPFSLGVIVLSALSTLGRVRSAYNPADFNYQTYPMFIPGDVLPSSNAVNLA